MFEPKVQRVQSAGPVYADVDFSYESDDDAATLWARHLEFPQTDENRTYYSFVIDFKKEVAALNQWYQKQLEGLGIPFYDPILIIEKTAGRMAEDDFWIKIER